MNGSSLLTLLPVVCVITTTSCLTETAKFPENLQKQWTETSMIDETLLSISGTHQVVSMQPESMGYTRLQLYIKASSKTRAVISEVGLPDIIRETNRPLRMPRLELFYIKKGVVYKFEGIKQLTDYYPDKPVVESISGTSQRELDHMKELTELQGAVR